MNDANKNLGCLAGILRLIGINLSRNESGTTKLPYRLRDEFLSAAELSFFHVLRTTVDGQFAICPKVRIADLLYVVNRKENMAYANRINQRHVDFVLCEPDTLQPMLIIELDDSSHSKSDRIKRDKQNDEAFLTAGLPILHVIAQRGYIPEQLKQQIESSLLVIADPTLPQPSSASTQPGLAGVGPPNCRKCGVTMVQRKAAKGRHKGKRFWACSSFPDCREIVPMDS